MFKMNKINVLVILGILLVMPLLNASTEYYEVDEQIDLKFTCTLNNAIPTDSATLNITISNPDGTTFINNQETTSRGNGAFNYTTTFTEIGTYKVEMFCYDGSYSFSNEGYYEVTGNGKPTPDGVVIVLFSILFLIIMGGLLYQLILSIGHFASLDLDVVDLAKSIGLYFSLFALYLLSVFYLGNPDVEGWLLILIEIGAFTHFILPMTAFLISITIGSLKKKKIDFGTRRIYRKNVGNVGGFN